MSETATTLENAPGELLRRTIPEEMQGFKAELKAHLDKPAKSDYRLPIVNEWEGNQGDKDEVGLDTEASSRSGRHCTEHPRDPRERRSRYQRAGCAAGYVDCEGGGR